MTKDPDLAAALDATRPVLDAKDTRSEAGHVRRLALIGARMLGTGSVEARAALNSLPACPPNVRDRGGAWPVVVVGGEVLRRCCACPRRLATLGFTVV